MTMIQQELWTVLLGTDREWFGDLHDLQANDVQLISAWGTFIGARLSSNDDRRLLGQSFKVRPDLFGHILFEDDALNDSSPVSNLREDQLATRANVIKPAFDSDFFADVLRHIAYVGLGHGSLRFCLMNW